MKEVLETLKGIFKDRVFKIPDYQRGYAWTTRQLKDFWEDIVNLPSDRYHYTGLLSLKEVDKNEWRKWIEELWLIEERGCKPFYIVDGQQRLTTIVILVNEIINFVKCLPDNQGIEDKDIYIGTYSLEQIKEEYIVIQKPPQNIIKSYKFGYETDNPSFQYLRHKILGEQDGGTIQETFYTLNLENAKSFFAENIKEFFKEFGLEEIESLFKKLTLNLKFNLHEIEDDFDVFVAFETMNNRGKKLSNLELLKNRLIYLTTLYSDDDLKRDERAVLRGKINDAWKEVYYQLGRNKQKPLSDDDFLNAHWIMYFQYSREKGEDYIRFLLDEKFTAQNIYTKTEVKVASVLEVEEVRDVTEQEETSENGVDEKTILRLSLPPKEIENYVGSLKSAALHWYNTFNPKNNQDLTLQESMWLDRLNRLGMAYFRPMITASFIAPDVNTEDRIRLFFAIERFIFLTFRVGRALSTYRNNEFYKATRQLRNGEASVEDICDILDERMDWLFYQKDDPTADETYFNPEYFKNYLQRLYKNGGGYYDWNGLKYFLYEYEIDKVRQFGNQKIDWDYFVKGEKDKVSIEHILPREPSDSYWKKEFKNFTKGQIANLTGSLGNLLPLSSSINSSLQNDSFHQKKNAKISSSGEKLRRGYSEGSYSEIEVAQYSDWNAESIFERGLKLLDFMEKRWDIKFYDDKDKKGLLFLEFIKTRKR